MSKTARIRVERLAAGGNGVGRIDGKACFIPFSAPDDLLDVRVTREHKNWCEAEILGLLEPSPFRVVPHCPHFGVCGGCNWQHLDYKYQCLSKQQILTDLLQRIARFENPPVADTVFATECFGYRARAQFKLHATDAGVAAGFFRKGSRFVIDLPEGCPVVTPAINRVLSAIKAVLDKLPDSNRVPQISLEEGIAGVVALVHYIGTDPDRLSALLLQNLPTLELAGLFMQSGRKDTLISLAGDRIIKYQLPFHADNQQMITVGYQIGSFSQVNRPQNRELVRLVADQLQPEPTGKLLDLYCGNGNLSLPLAGSVKQITGVEEYAPSIASAIDNARELRVNNSSFSCIDAFEAVRKMVETGERFDSVLLDPPRDGAAGLAGQVGRLKPQKIVYVSCDPATLARDLAIICKSSSYKLVEAVPLDMFPQTGHIETVALLERKGGQALHG